MVSMKVWGQSLEVHEFFAFNRFIGMMFTDSSDTSQNPSCGYGTGGDIDIEGIQYGMVVTASNTPGYKFTNLFLESQLNMGEAAVQGEKRRFFVTEDFEAPSAQGANPPC